MDRRSASSIRTRSSSCSARGIERLGCPTAPDRRLRAQASSTASSTTTPRIAGEPVDARAGHLESACHASAEEERPMSLDIRNDSRRFPDPRHRDARSPAHVSRQRRERTEAPSRHRGDVGLLSAHYANIHRGVYQLSAEATLATKTSERASRISSVRQIPARSSSFETRPRRSTSWLGAGVKQTSAAATRSSSRRWSTTRTSSPGRCSRTRVGAKIRVARVTDCGCSRCRPSREPARPAHEAPRLRPRLERARHDQPGP